MRLFRDRLVAAQTGKPAPKPITPAGTAFKWPGGNVLCRFDAAQVSSRTITVLKMQQFRFQITSTAGVGSDVQITFRSVAGKTYRLDYRNDLIAGN